MKPKLTFNVRETPTCKSCYKLPPSQARNPCKNTTKRLHTSCLPPLCIYHHQRWRYVPSHLYAPPFAHCSGRFLGKPEVAELKLTTLFFSSTYNETKYWLPLLFSFWKLSNAHWTFYSSLMVRWLLWYAIFIRSLGLPPLLSVSNCT